MLPESASRKARSASSKGPPWRLITWMTPMTPWWPRSGADVVHAQRASAAHHVARDPPIGGEAQPRQALGDLRALLGDVGEVELAALGVEQKDGGPLRVEHLAALADDERHQLVELGAR